MYLKEKERKKSSDSLNRKEEIFSSLFINYTKFQRSVTGDPERVNEMHPLFLRSLARRDSSSRKKEGTRRSSVKLGCRYALRVRLNALGSDKTLSIRGRKSRNKKKKEWTGRVASRQTNFQTSDHAGIGLCREGIVTL